MLHGKHSFGKVINEVWYQACDLMRFIQQTHIYILLQTSEHQINKWKPKNQAFSSFCEINATKFGTKTSISHKIIYHYMTSYGYIIMVIVDSCIFYLISIVSCSWSNHTILLLMFVAEKVLLLLVISLTAKGLYNQFWCFHASLPVVPFSYIV